MDALRRSALRALPSLRRKSISLNYSTLQGGAHRDWLSDRKFVRIAGPAACSTRDDIIDFMQRNGVDMSAFIEGKFRHLTTVESSGSTRQSDAKRGVHVAPIPNLAVESKAPETEVAVEASVGDVGDEASDGAETLLNDVDDEPTAIRIEKSAEDESSGDTNGPNAADSLRRMPLLGQGISESFMNVSNWYYDAGSHKEAFEIANKLHGKVCGMKLTRVAAVDERVAREVPGLTKFDSRSDAASSGHSRSYRLAVLAPSNEERDRSLLLTGLRPLTQPRTVWGFFSGYDVASVRLLRKIGIASVSFRDVPEMERVLRERCHGLVQRLPDLKVSHHS